ncbi:hypothetical protein JCM10908_001445 [Rhodotorula pacifica]|uniref:uncharacterized protein n=1 Tax=Rhodotorula pacifica TaxID=1495444 RepID=UPI00316FF74A
MAKLKKSFKNGGPAARASQAPKAAPAVTTTSATARRPSSVASTTTSHGSAPIPLRSAAHLSEPVGLPESVVAALDEVEAGQAGSSSAGLVAWPLASSTASTSPSSPRFYRTRVASSSTIASQDTLSTPASSSAASPGSGSALAKLRSRLDSDQAAREEAASKPHQHAKLRRRSHKPASVVSVEEESGATLGADVAEQAESSSHEVHDPPDFALVADYGASEPVGLEAIPPVATQLPEPVYSVAGDPAPSPAPEPPSSFSPASILFAPVRLGWRVATAPARLSYRAASFGVGVVGSGIALGQDVAQFGIATAVSAAETGLDLASHAPVVGGVVTAVLGRAPQDGAAKALEPSDVGQNDAGQTALLRLRDTVSPIRIAMAALQVSLGVAMATVLVARAVVELAVARIRGPPAVH